MKAIDIINFINEDKFSKYTSGQIYNELGKEDFIEYLEKICTKIINNLVKKRDLGPVKPEIKPLSVYSSIHYRLDHDEQLDIQVIGGNDNADIFINYTIEDYVAPHVVIYSSDVNIIPLIEAGIKRVYNMITAQKARLNPGLRRSMQNYRNKTRRGR
jgi:hypothetical protein